MAGWIEVLRTGAWLTRPRMRLVAFALLAATLIGAGSLVATSDGLNNRLGRPLGADFSNVYAAGSSVAQATLIPLAVPLMLMAFAFVVKLSWISPAAADNAAVAAAE